MGRPAPLCRVCGGGDLHLYRQVDEFRFNHCGGCGSITEETAATLPDTPAHLPPEEGIPPSLKFYIEVGASLSFFAESVAFLELLLPAGDRRLLDVGGSFGFAVSMAASRGWEAVGVEPSFMGEFGSRMLGVRIIQSYLEDSGLSEGAYSAVYSAEVIEHVADQDGFLQTLGRFAAPDGLLLLTTPNAQALTRQPVEPEWPEMLSAGSHVSLLSPAGAEMLLRRNGFADVRIWTVGGDTGRKRLVIAAARRPGLIQKRLSFAAAERAAGPLLSQYLDGLAAQKESQGENDPLYHGALYRLVEHRLSRRQPARETIRRLDAALEKAGIGDDLLDSIDPDGFDDYVGRVPAFAGLYTFDKGVHALTQLRDYPAAAAFFRRAARLLEIEDRLQYYPRAGWPERARQHQGMALRYGRTAGVRRLADSLLPPGTGRRAAARRLLRALHNSRARHQVG